MSEFESKAPQKSGAPKVDEDSADVTVIVPAYNAAPYIADCLRSILSQSWQGWRCIVVNDGSSDDTVERASEFQGEKIRIVSQANAGVSAARNRGLKEADTPYVMFLDADDLLHPSALERLRRGFAQNPEAVASFGALRKVLRDGAPYPGQKPLELMSYPTGDVLRDIIRENFLANGGQVLVLKSAADGLGGFSTRLRLSEDWEFWCRLAACGQFHYVGAPPEIFSLRMTPGSASGGLSSHWENHQDAINAVLGNPVFASRFSGPDWRKLSRQVWASHRWEAGRVNFTYRNFAIARRLMLQSLGEDPNPKRLVMFLIAQISMVTNRSLLSRLRFRSDDDI